jgi:putative Holliday junction resolvase
MRVLAVDFGERRIGLAVSDPSGTIARPLSVVQGSTDPVRAALAVVAAIVAFEQADERIDTIVVGRPAKLDGSPTDQTQRVEAFAADLGRRAGRPVILRDERLTSHEADALLAEHEADWRARKKKLDAAAAAVILQEYLDGGGGR